MTDSDLNLRLISLLKIHTVRQVLKQISSDIIMCVPKKENVIQQRKREVTVMPTSHVSYKSVYLHNTPTHIILRNGL